MSRAFITGSQVYGTPNEDSDIDLVILVDGDVESHDALELLAAKGEPVLAGAEDYGDHLTIRFGDLNLIVFTDEVPFEAWRKTTNELIARRPVTRDEAIKAMMKADGRADANPEIRFL